MIARALVVACLVCGYALPARGDKHSDKKGPAPAEKPAAPPAEKAPDPHELAKAHYATAIQLIKSGKHREAIAEFDQAYQAARLPNILFNIAQEYRALTLTDDPLEKVNDLHSAVTYYRRYLDARKDAPDMIDVEKAIAELEAALPAALRGAAKQHYARAVDLIKNGQHREAIAEFQLAYQLAALPNILFNIAREYHALGDSGGEAAMSEVPDMRQAVAFYQQYLAAAKGSSDRPEVERAVAALQQRIYRAEHPRPAEPRPIAVSRPAPQAVRAFDADEESAPSVRRGRTFTVAGVALLAAGALIAAGGAVGLAIDHPNPIADRDFVFSFGGGSGISGVASPLQPLYIAAIAVGGVAAIGGVVLLALGTRREKAARASIDVAPLVGSGVAGALFSGSF